MTKELNGSGGDFFLLTISRQAIKLYAGKESNLEQIDLTGVVPTNMDEALLCSKPPTANLTAWVAATLTAKGPSTATAPVKTPKTDT